MDEARLAVHEAGHALACMLSRTRFREVQIDSETGGGFVVSMVPPPAMSWRALAEKRLTVSLGGIAAESVFFGLKGVNTAGTKSDFYWAQAWAVLLLELRSGSTARGPRAEWKEAILSTVGEGFQRLLAKMLENKPAVQALAVELQRRKRISGREARRIMQEAMAVAPQAPKASGQ